MDKRIQILDAAQRTLQRKGLVGTTTRAITTEAGCAEGTLYLYFKNRADLFLSLFERRLGAAFPGAEGAPMEKGDADPNARLLEIGLQFLKFHRDVGTFLASLFAEPELLKQYRSLVLARYENAPRAAPAIVAYIRKAQRRGAIGKGVDASVAAEALLGACFARAFHDNLFDEPVSKSADRKFLRSLIASLLR